MILEIVHFLYEIAKSNPFLIVIFGLIGVIGVLLFILIRTQKTFNIDSKSLSKSVKKGDVAIYTILKDVKKSSDDLCKKVVELGIHNIKATQVSEIQTRSLERIADKMATISSDIQAFLYIKRNGKK